MLNKIDVNEQKIIKIGEKCSISITEYTKRLNTFYDVSFNNNGNEIFIGRYVKEDNLFRVYYKDGKILVCIEKYISSIANTAITKVLTLYDILDDTFYSVSGSNALELFDSSLNSNFIKDKDKSIARLDSEKMRRHIMKLEH